MALTSSKYMPKRNGRPGRPQSTTWAAFIRAHVAGALAIDATLSRVIRDRDGLYEKVFDARVKRLGLEQFRIAPRSVLHVFRQDTRSRASTS